jgi:acetylornithine deacetylase/succinyl-diaminopimelate desuccinylase-like protein
VTSARPELRSRYPRPLGTRELAEVSEFLRIPSISTDVAHASDVDDALVWVEEFVRRSGGSAEVVRGGTTGIVDALLPASTHPSTAPTVLIWGHVDVQPPAPLELWESGPFEPETREGWLYGRGVADDKGQIWAMLRAAANLAGTGALPVNVRFCCDGEEEIGGTTVVDYLADSHGGAEACLILDAPMLDDSTPAFTIGARGTLYMHVEVSTGARDLHSGVYGGVALNAVHVLASAIANVTARNGRLPDPLLAGTRQIEPAERQTWTSLPAGRDLLADEGAAPADEAAGEEFYLRSWGLPSLDVNGIEGGSPEQLKTIVVARARANLSMRLAAGQTVSQLVPVVEAELRRGLPETATLDVTVRAACDPGEVPRDVPAVRLAADAFEDVLGVRPPLLRTGGSLPLMPLLERLQLPSVVTGFARPASNMHAPNERMRLTDLECAIAAVEATLVAFRDL